jgi:HEAT repeat protein
MSVRRLATVLLAVTLSGIALGAAPRPADFEGAKWIWYRSGLSSDQRSFPGGACFFRAAVTLPEDSLIESAELVITADNLYTFYVNGTPAGEGHTDPNLWHRPKRFDVAGLLGPARNLIAIEAINTVPGPAGLLAKLSVQMADGRKFILASDAMWKATDQEVANWQQPSLDDQAWGAALVVAQYGDPPWRKPAARGPAEHAGPPSEPARIAARSVIQALKAAARHGAATSGASLKIVEGTPTADFAWPGAVAFLGDDCTLYRPFSHTASALDSLSVTVFTARKSKAFPEHDLPTPLKMGRKLFLVRPGPGAQPRLLVDAGRGGIGSPCVSFDGQWIYVAMAQGNETFFHIYRIPAAGGAPLRLTDGPFHDIDPAELPDGRIVFTSTRIGMFDEYHNPPARALYAMQPDGSRIEPLTHTFVFDNEPEVLADGRILFIRSDNFFDRGKVETLLHAVHPDGSEGYTEFGLDNGPEYGGRLRAFYCGSPAPMPDGRVAFVSSSGVTVARPGWPQKDWRHVGVEAGDVAPLPDGRLLCTLPRKVQTEVTVGQQTRKVADYCYDKIAVVELGEGEARVVSVFESAGSALHSPVYVGARVRPPVLRRQVEPEDVGEPSATGVFVCANARFTKNTTAGWPHVRAVRVLAGKGLTTRSSHSYIVHAGSEAIELGTVPLAPDGSFAVEVPADMPIAFQAVDAEGRSELNEMSWIYVRPGERRACLGCHHPRQAAPATASAMPLALSSRPLRLLGKGQPHRFRANNAAVTGLMELQFDRYREVAGIDRHGQLGNPLATVSDEAVALARQLPDADDALKISSAQRLSIFRDPVAAPALAHCLASAAREARVAAAMSLAACGTRESVPALLAALDDTDPLVRQAAAVALENLTGHIESLATFAAPADRAPQVERWHAWFRGTSWAAIETQLIEQLANGNRDQQRRAAVALGHIGGDAARNALRSYVLAHRDENPYPEWRAAGHRGDGARFNALSPANPRTLQAATRALGYLHDRAAVPMLAETLRAHAINPDQGNLFLAEAAVEALGRIGTPEAETALLATFADLVEYIRYTVWYGDHPALMACHASPVHYFITEELDRMASRRAGSIVPHLIRSVPTDVDRALLLETDDCETMTGRVIRRAGAEPAVVDTCLALLGDSQAKPSKDLEDAIGTVYQAWGGTPNKEIRAAQILSLVCRDSKYEPRVRAAFERYRALPKSDIARVFDRGIPIVLEMPTKNWACFFLARTLGNLGDPRSVECLIATLEQTPGEGVTGQPDPTGPGSIFLHNELTPCWRAAAAWALGRLGDRRAAPVLLRVAADIQNAIDTRHAAAEALARIADPASLEAIRRLAANYPETSTRRALMKACQ